MKKNLLLLIFCASINFSYAQLDSAFYLNTGSWTANSNASVKLAKDLGAVAAGNGVKIVWRNIQATPTSSYTWSSLDAIVTALQNDTLDMFAYILCINPFSSSTIPCAVSYNPSGPNGGQSWFPEDTVSWKVFLDAVIERYDKDGISDMPGLSSR